MQEILITVDVSPQSWGGACTVGLAERAAVRLAQDLAAIANCLFPEARVRHQVGVGDVVLLRTRYMSEADETWLREKLIAWREENWTDVLQQVNKEGDEMVTLAEALDAAEEVG